MKSARQVELAEHAPTPSRGIEQRVSLAQNPGPFVYGLGAEDSQSVLAIDPVHPNQSPSASYRFHGGGRTCWIELLRRPPCGLNATSRVLHLGLCALTFNCLKPTSGLPITLGPEQSQLALTDEALILGRERGPTIDMPAEVILSPAAGAVLVRASRLLSPSLMRLGRCTQ